MLTIRSAQQLPEAEPPSEFLIFKRGVNDSVNGPVLFDEESARSVLEADQAHGVDKMVDLEHLSLDKKLPTYDPDARAAFKLELRDGDLWATDVKWTDDGARRIREKRQRYISPAFYQKDGKVQRLVNVGLTSLPATHQMPALVAASEVSMPDESKPDMSALACELGLSPDATPEEMLAKIQELKAAPATAPEPSAEPAPAPPAESPPEEGIAVRSITAMTGQEDLSASLDQIKTWREAFLKQEAQEAKNEADRKALETVERRSLVVKLVKLGAEVPATAWSDSTGKEPCLRLASEPIGDLRARVETLSKAKPEVRNELKQPAAAAFELSKRQLALCTELNVNPQEYAAFMSARGK